MATRWSDEEARTAALDLLGLVTAFDDDERLAVELVESQSTQASREQLVAALPFIHRFVQSVCGPDLTVKDWVANASDHVRNHT
jgi:hypothetical protein